MTLKDKSEEPFANIRFNLENIKGKEGIVGYILRNSKFVSVNIDDSTKIMDYAMLSSESLETGEITSEIFELGSINSIIVEGNDVKVLSLVVGDQRLSVFMDKKVDHNKIAKELELTKHTQKRGENSNHSNDKNQEYNEAEASI